MSALKGRVVAFSATVLQIQEAVETCVEYGQLDVEVKDIVELTHLSKKTVSSAMGAKAKAGCFIRVRPGVYHVVVGTKLTNRLPAAFVAEKAWAVLDANKSRFLSLPEVEMEVETRAGQRDLSLKLQVQGLLYRWHKSGYLDRNGRRGNYSYRILPGIISRPPVEN